MNGGRRVAGLTPFVFSRVNYYERNEFGLGALWEAHDLVFCSEWGTPHSIPNLTYRYFRPILEKAKLPRIRLYDLHSHATLLLSENEHPKVVSERLGHSSITLTLDTYSHVLPTMQEGTSQKLESLPYSKKKSQFKKLGRDAGLQAKG